MKKTIIALLMFLSFTAVNAQTYRNADTKTFKETITKEEVQLLDVRTPREFFQGHIKGAKNINMMDKNFVAQVTKTLDKKKTIFVYCRSGGRSARASQVLSKAGFKIVNLQGGILGWQKAKYPIDK